ncbi:MAG: hypothetical protein WCJ74_02920 [bacterium]
MKKYFVSYTLLFKGGIFSFAIECEPITQEMIWRAPSSGRSQLDDLVEKEINVGRESRPSIGVQVIAFSELAG